jgi:AcrR family transcriptional regulator
MDDIAAAAAVSRRSLFRHFESREALVAEALERSLAWYFGRVAEQVDEHLPLEEWLVALARRIHRLQLESGRAMWQLAAASDDELAPSLVAVNRLRRANARRFTQRVTAHAWRLAGADGEPPDEVADAFVFTLSSYATRSAIGDRRISLDRTSTSAGAVLDAIIRARLP